MCSYLGMGLTVFSAVFGVFILLTAAVTVWAVLK